MSGLSKSERSITSSHGCILYKCLLRKSMFAYSLLDKLLFPFATDLSKTHASLEATWAIKHLSNLQYRFNWFFAFGDI